MKAIKRIHKFLIIFTIVFLFPILNSHAFEVNSNNANTKNNFVSQNTVTNKKQTDKQIFEELFNQWTMAFNQKNLDKTCSLFSKSIKAKHKGIPNKNYQSICEGFSKIFSENNKKYLYSFEIHDVYRQGNLAAVRITWYLQVQENGRSKSIIQDEGLDILEKNLEGQWKIVNYLSFQD